MIGLVKISVAWFTEILADSGISLTLNVVKERVVTLIDCILARPLERMNQG